MDPSDQKAGMCESSWHMLPCIHHCIHASIHPSIPPYLATYLPTGRPTDIHTYMLDMSDTYLYTCVVCIHAAILCQGSSVQVVCYNMLHTQKHLNAFVSRYTTSVMTIIGRVLLGLYKTRDKAIAARAYKKYVWHREDVHSYDRADIMQSHPYCQSLPHHHLLPACFLSTYWIINTLQCINTYSGFPFCTEYLECSHCITDAKFPIFLHNCWKAGTSKLPSRERIHIPPWERNIIFKSDLGDMLVPRRIDLSRRPFLCSVWFWRDAAPRFTKEVDVSQDLYTQNWFLRGKWAGFQNCIAESTAEERYAGSVPVNDLCRPFFCVQDHVYRKR